MIIYFFINIMVSDFGEVAERLKAAVLKTVARLVRALRSNLSLSAISTISVNFLTRREKVYAIREKK